MTLSSKMLRTSGCVLNLSKNNNKVKLIMQLLMGGGGRWGLIDMAHPCGGILTLHACPNMEIFDHSHSLPTTKQVKRINNFCKTKIYKETN